MHKLAPLLFTAALAACGQPPPPGPALRAQARPLTCEAQQARLLTASQGLLYLSETDAPLTVVVFPSQTLPTPAEIAATAGLGPDAEVQTVDFEAWFRPLVRAPEPGVYDPAVEAQARLTARRYRELRQVFRKTYRERRVYRVRDAVNDPAVWRVFVLGTGACGVSGLETVAIET